MLMPPFLRKGSVSEEFARLGGAGDNEEREKTISSWQLATLTVTPIVQASDKWDSRIAADGVNFPRSFDFLRLDVFSVKIYAWLVISWILRLQTDLRLALRLVKRFLRCRRNHDLVFFLRSELRFVNTPWGGHGCVFLVLMLLFTIRRVVIARICVVIFSCLCVRFIVTAYSTYWFIYFVIVFHTLFDSFLEAMFHRQLIRCSIADYQQCSILYSCLCKLV